jgi:hypothetical protein
LKKIHIEHNCHEKIQDVLEEICQKEGIKFSKIHDKLPWAQDDKCIIEKNKKPYLIGCDEISNNLLSSFKFKYKIDGSREYGFTTGGNTFIGKYPNGEKWILIGEDEFNQGLKKEDISKTYQIKKENIFIIPQQSFHLDMFLRPIGFPYILVNDPKIAKKNIETHFKDSPLKKQFLINLLLQEKGCSCEKTIKKLEKRILEVLEIEDESYHRPSFSNERQLGLLNKAMIELQKAKDDALFGLTLDLVAVAIQEAYQSILEILGEAKGNDFSEEIFSRFCVGK